MDPEWTSSYYLENYRRVQQTWLYESDLDLVAVAPDGSLAVCCIGWFDTTTRWAEIEPLGVVPDHRGRGLASALCAAMARRVARAGGQHLYINTRPVSPVPGTAPGVPQGGLHTTLQSQRGVCASGHPVSRTACETWVPGGTRASLLRLSARRCDEK